ncbi:MAG: saccharopine dehydrogenase [Sphingomonadales bacterium]|nr:saccharopine dehydrogenase [Sphingomonadales bacterium]
MKTILLFGAGKSASVLITYLLRQAPLQGFQLKVVDSDLSLAQSKLNGSPHGTALGFDSTHSQLRMAEIEQADLVISLLPPALHQLVAMDCLQLHKNLLTASYVSEELKKLDTELKSNDLLFLCEMGLDPGIDHMSAMALFASIHQQGGTIHSFVSHCGGLVSSSSDNNPWHYKISWNPRNVVTAGQAGAQFLLNGKKVALLGEEVFAQENAVAVDKVGTYGWYPNRDSLSYLSLYELKNLNTFIRTTLRHPDFIKGWNKLIRLSLTKDTPAYQLREATLGKGFAHHFERHHLQDLVSRYRKEDPIFDQQLHFLGVDGDTTPLSGDQFTPAQLLQESLERKLVLEKGDRDMIIMLHEIGYTVLGQRRKLNSQLVVEGENSIRTAMAKTVGLPLAMAAILVLQNKISLRGVQIPTHKEIYEPVLAELEKEGIVFTESDGPATN